MGRGVDRGGGDGVAGTGTGTGTGTVTGTSTGTGTGTSTVTVTGTGTVTVGSIRLWVISHFRRLFSPSPSPAAFTATPVATGVQSL